MTVNFCSELDKLIARNGPAGLFKINSDGELAFDLMRSRRLRADNEGPFPPCDIHCVLIDQQTNWPQYALITSAALTIEIANTIVKKFPTMNDALEAISKHKAVHFNF